MADLFYVLYMPPDRSITDGSFDSEDAAEIGAHSILSKSGMGTQAVIVQMVSVVKPPSAPVFEKIAAKDIVIEVKGESVDASPAEVVVP